MKMYHPLHHFTLTVCTLSSGAPRGQALRKLGGFPRELGLPPRALNIVNSPEPESKINIVILVNNFVEYVLKSINYRTF